MGDEPDGLEARLSQAERRVQALEDFASDALRLRRMLDEARSRQDAALADDLETRLRVAEEELREAAASLSRTTWSLPAGAQPSHDALRRALLEEAAALVKAALSGTAFRGQAEAAAREAAAPLEARLSRLETTDRSQAALDTETLERQIASVDAHLGSLQDRLARFETALKRQDRALLDIETVEQQIATVQANLGSLQDRLQAMPAAAPPSGDGAVSGLRREMEARLAALPGPDAIEAAVRRAGAALDAQLSERLAGLLAAQPAPAVPGGAIDPAALLGQIRELVGQAMADAFPMEELGRIIDQKVVKRSEAMRQELRDVEAGLVQAIMKHLETKPLGEAQVAALIDQRVNELLLKHVQR